MSKTSKPTPQKSKFNQKNDYYTDDSDSGTPKNVNNNKNQSIINPNFIFELKNNPNLRHLSIQNK